ncbi:MAG: hypothetical protein ACTHMD_09870 [Flavisolibacter sp.]
MKLFLLVIFTFAFSSCKHAWTQKDKETFMGGCVNGALKEMDEAKARSYCSCMLQKLQARYPNAADMKYVKNDTAVHAMAVECMK